MVLGRLAHSPDGVATARELDMDRNRCISMVCGPVDHRIPRVVGQGAAGQVGHCVSVRDADCYCADDRLCRDNGGRTVGSLWIHVANRLFFHCYGSRDNPWVLVKTSDANTDRVLFFCVCVCG